MIITENQLQVLFLVLQESVSMDIIGHFSISIDKRVQLANDILNQQSSDLIEVKGNQ